MSNIGLGLFGNARGMQVMRAGIALTDFEPFEIIRLIHYDSQEINLFPNTGLLALIRLKDKYQEKEYLLFAIYSYAKERNTNRVGLASGTFLMIENQLLSTKDLGEILQNIYKMHSYLKNNYLDDESRFIKDIDQEIFPESLIHEIQLDIKLTSSSTSTNYEEGTKLCYYLENEAVIPAIDFFKTALAKNIQYVYGTYHKEVANFIHRSDRIPVQQLRADYSLWEARETLKKAQDEAQKAHKQLFESVKELGEQKNLIARLYPEIYDLKEQLQRRSDSNPIISSSEEDNEEKNKAKLKIVKKLIEQELNITINFDATDWENILTQAFKTLSKNNNNSVSIKGEGIDTQILNALISLLQKKNYYNVNEHNIEAIINEVVPIKEGNNTSKTKSFRKYIKSLILKLSNLFKTLLIGIIPLLLVLLLIFYSDNIFSLYEKLFDNSQKDDISTTYSNYISDNTFDDKIEEKLISNYSYNQEDKKLKILNVRKNYYNGLLNKYSKTDSNKVVRELEQLKNQRHLYYNTYRDEVDKLLNVENTNKPTVQPTNDINQQARAYITTIQKKNYYKKEEIDKFRNNINISKENKNDLNKIYQNFCKSGSSIDAFNSDFFNIEESELEQDTMTMTVDELINLIEKEKNLNIKEEDKQLFKEMLRIANPNDIGNKDILMLLRRKNYQFRFYVKK